MKHKSIRYSSIFLKALKKLPKSQLANLSKKESVFKEDPFAIQLKTHKLKGKLSEFYSFSLSYHWRIVFHFENEDTIIFDSVGTHEVYQ